MPICLRDYLPIRIDTMKPTFIAIQDDAYWIRVDRIDAIEFPCYDSETGDLTRLRVRLGDERYTIVDPDDIKKITDRIEVV